MAKDAPKRGARTEALSLRLDPKTKFILDFMVRVTGIKITDLVERSIKKMADETLVRHEDVPVNWMYYWDPREGVRTIKLLSDPDVYTNFDEDELIAFIKDHWEFFSLKPDLSSLVGGYIDVIWPRIDEFREHWRQNRANNRWSTGEIMLAAINAANMKGPDWPRVAKPPLSPKPFDDDIPF